MFALPTEALRRLDHRHLWHPFTPMKLWLDSDPLVITAADGMHLIDSDGNRYLDGVSSLWCNVHGHRVPEIDAAIRAQLDKVAHTTMLGLASEPAILLADRLMHLVPKSLKKVFYSDSGATATEIAFKMAAQYWYNIGQAQRTEFVGFSHGYHGDTVGAMSIGRTEAFHRPYFPLLFKTHFAPSPFVYRSQWPDDPQRVRDDCLAKLEAMLAKHGSRIAAICIEPIVQGAAGIIIHPGGFLREVRRMATAYDTLLICDEVAVGFGRTGKMFACEHEGVEPDLMCVGKGITGGYLPLAATFASQRIFDAFLGEPWEGKTFYHGHTYTGNPLACAAAIASLELFDGLNRQHGRDARVTTGPLARDTGVPPVLATSCVDPSRSPQNLLARVADKAHALTAMLAELRELSHVGDIRQKGFMVGIELVEDKATRRPYDPRRRVGAEICAKTRKHGVILRPLGDVLVMMPPLAMESADLQRIVSAVNTELKRME